jgi:hypothetical protein
MEAPTNDDTAPTPSRVFSAFLLRSSIAIKKHYTVKYKDLSNKREVRYHTYVGVRGIKALENSNAMSRVAFLVVASMVLTTMIVAIASTFTNNKWLLITTEALATTTALTTITTAILLSDDYAHH